MNKENLNKELCLKALEFLWDEAACEYEIEDGELVCYDRTQYDEYLKPYLMLDLLIHEYFKLEGKCKYLSRVVNELNSKETRSKPIKRIEEYHTYHYICPICGCIVEEHWDDEIRNEPNYCCNCGCKLDWSEE